MKPDKSNERLLIVGGVLLVGYVVYNVVQGAKSLAEAVGFKDSADTKNLDDVAKNPYSFWSPNFYRQQGSGALLLTRAAAEEMAREVYDSFGWFDDDEERAIAVLKGLRSQTQVSFLSSVFGDLYQQDLLTFLRGGIYPKDRLSDADVNELNSYISRLPKK